MHIVEKQTRKENIRRRFKNLDPSELPSSSSDEEINDAFEGVDLNQVLFKEDEVEEEDVNGEQEAIDYILKQANLTNLVLSKVIDQFQEFYERVKAGELKIVETGKKVQSSTITRKKTFKSKGGKLLIDKIEKKLGQLIKAK